jgi:cellulose synthase/poly-beta-1,6-N-acetylglucosamine synthase-like glycosyltransferase
MTPGPFAPPTAATTLLAWAQLLAVVAYALAQLLIVVYASHRYLLLWRWRQRGPARRGALPPSGQWEPLPCVTVQLPVFNESRVVGRLIDAAAALEYPPGRLEIQVLDDSTDETREHAAAAVARHRALGLDIQHLRRPRRDGYKAGALAAGLARSRGALVAVFDADFVPPADFLLRLVPRFADPAVGMVQARWGHLNRARSPLTAAQATLLDAHFLIEHRARMHAGLFFNFNGTAGIWRRACIDDSGGWSHDTLTEDLDLSYRAQLRGWRFVFDSGVEAPAELPGDMEALKSQQRRWTKGSIQTARKLLPGVWRAPLPGRVKLEALFHLTSNVAYPLLLALGLLLLPVLLAPTSLPAVAVWAIQAGVVALGVVPVCVFLAVGRRVAGGSLSQVIRDVPSALVLGVGLSVNNALAVLEGLGPRVGDWERTPKTGDTAQRPAKDHRYPSARGLAGRSELALAAWFVGVSIFAWRAGHLGALPFTALLVVGFGSVGLGSLKASLVSRQAGGVVAGG